MNCMQTIKVKYNDNIVFFGKWQQYPAMLAVIFNLHKCRIFLTINLYMLINLQ
uniref:Uncharacterized protein n=1 Tax=Rhizophagus irregularis (strain DAOM 181602 / DAOM 197198 / MUCL 43194) TaxID=747089 RepID=U9UDD4_RHIID